MDTFNTGGPPSERVPTTLPEQILHSLLYRHSRKWVRCDMLSFIKTYLSRRSIGVLPSQKYVDSWRISYVFLMRHHPCSYSWYSDDVRNAVLTSQWIHWLASRTDETRMCSNMMVLIKWCSDQHSIIQSPDESFVACASFLSTRWNTMPNWMAAGLRAFTIKYKMCNLAV